MHFLIGFIVASWLLWTLTRRAVRQFGRAPRPQPSPPLLHQPPVVTTAIQGPRHRTARYALITLLALAVGWFSRGLLLPEHRSPKSPVPAGVTAIVAPSKSREPSGSVAIKTPQNPETPHPSEDGCEWVSSFTREDGSYVSGHWSSKRGYAGECSLPEPQPLPTPHEKAAIHVGPRGGHFHYSKSGKKVYER